MINAMTGQLSPNLTASRIRTLLVDDHPFFLRVLRRFLESHVAVVGAATNGEECLTEVTRLQPQLIVLDLSMPGLSGLDLIPRLREAVPETRVVILTLHDTEADRRAALEAGAQGFVSKARLFADLLPAIGRVMEGDHVPN